MKTFFNLFGLTGILFFSYCQQPGNISDAYINGVSTPVISLNGQWHLTQDPPNGFHENVVRYQGWEKVEVPGELVMQGIPVEHDKSYVYKKSFVVPADYIDKTIQLQFDGVYSYAKVWVNGTFITEHYGGFTSWTCDITNTVTPGEEAVLILEVKDLINDISYGSGYAKHPIGGILRDVTLMALPSNHIESLIIETELDKQYEHADLIIKASTSEKMASSLTLELFDPSGQKVKLSQSTISIDEGVTTGVSSSKIQSPALWDAEHPHLYTLVISMIVEDVIVQKKKYSVGFREIEVLGNKLLVNGKPVKLRGANRHDIHPLLGRTTNREYDEQDVLLAKEANINFIRTSHYPPTDRFLDYCDKYGIYVEDESAVCFVETHRDPAYNEVDHYGPQFKNQFISQISEMMTAHRNHPSVIIWSIGNESKYSSNFQAAYDRVKTADTTRPVIFSYPGTVPDTVKCYDILSIHYPGYNGNINQGGLVIKKFENTDMPVIFDEWAHVACYNNATLEVDPNVRNFWGQSLDLMWGNLFDSDGGLGGAIWGYIDETFMLSENVTAHSKWWHAIRDSKRGSPLRYAATGIGYGEWGIIDSWRRKKPEFWNTKKAYSPAKILVKRISEYNSGQPIEVPIHNRFDHTNLNELKVTWKYKEQSGSVNALDIEPHEKGAMMIPANTWQSGQNLEIHFYTSDTFLVDSYSIPFGTVEDSLPKKSTEALELLTDKKSVIVKGHDFQLVFNKSSGLIEAGSVKGQELLSGGPWPNVVSRGKSIAYNLNELNINDAKWELESLDYERASEAVQVILRGRMGKLDVQYQFQIYNNGIITIKYEMNNLPAKSKIQELGLRFTLPNNFIQLSWNRSGWWTTYPENHLGMLKGTIPLSSKQPTVYRSEPKQAWEMDTRSYYYNKMEWTSGLTNLARAMKENITDYRLIRKDGSNISLYSDGSDACRLADQGNHLSLYANSRWDYANLRWGNFMREIEFDKTHRGEITLRLSALK